MKSRHIPRFLPLLIITVSFSSAMIPNLSLATTNQFWNIEGPVGDGNWGTGPGDKNWNTLAGGSTLDNTSWPDTGDEVAVFQSTTGGIITVFDPVQTTGIIQDGADCLINAGTITLVHDTAMSQPFIDVKFGTLVIDTTLDGSDGLFKIGNGNLLLSNTNTYIGTTTINAGTLTLSGSLASTVVNITEGTELLDQAGGLDDNAALTNDGKLMITAADTVATYTQTANGALAGTAALSVNNLSTLEGGTVSGHLLGNTISTGDVLLSVSGTTGGGSLTISGSGKTLTLAGSSTNTTVDIAVGATLLDSHGGLIASANLTNSGNLLLDSNELIASYISNGGTLSTSASTLTCAIANLQNNSLVAGILTSNDLTINGNVSISGTATANTINIATGILTNTGTLGSITSHLDIAGDSTLRASGTQQYSLLTTSGSRPGTWQSNLTNDSIVAPGGLGGLGTLQVIGNFTNALNGILKLDIATANHDMLVVTGNANFGGTLDLHQADPVVMAPFVPIHVVEAGSYTGNFTELISDLKGAVWFNPASGDIIRVAVPSGYSSGNLFDSTTNQTSTWLALYDDVIDPGTPNIIYQPDGNPAYHITNGIANGNNPDLLWSLTASFTPNGLNSALLNRLSPEVYTGLEDYAVQATRTHQRTAFDAPTLASSRAADSNSQCKDAIAPITMFEWELFAASDYFNVKTTNSLNQANYELSGLGIMAGVRTWVTEHARLAAYLAGDDGTVDGLLINADGHGWSIGLLGDIMLDEKANAHLSTGISYGGYTFDGNRGSASATVAGWLPGQTHFNDVNSDSLELYIGIHETIYQRNHFRLIPSFGLHYATGSMDSFTESTGTSAGSPIALAVNQDHYQSAFTELSMLAEANITHELTLWGQLGGSAGFGPSEDPLSITARFATGNRTMRAEADGLSHNMWFIGLGTIYQISDSIGLALGLRSEFRVGANNQNSINLSSTFRF